MKILTACLILLIGLSGISHAGEIRWDDLIQAIIVCESGGDASAVSKDGAIGLMQITPIVLREFALTERWALYGEESTGFTRYIPSSGRVTSHGNKELKIDFQKYKYGINEMLLFHEDVNKYFGKWYLHRLKNHYLKDNFTIERLLGAWNMGHARLKRLKYQYWRVRETKRFVKKVMKLYAD